MFGVKFETWASICDMYFSLKKGSLKSYLQWFPFTKLTSAEKEIIKSKEFYEKYINTASFVFSHLLCISLKTFYKKGMEVFEIHLLLRPFFI